MGKGVMVFAPLPQLTVMVEQVSDEPELHLHAGGQGLWQARMITALNVPVTFCALLGKGEVGRVLISLFDDEGLELKAVRRHADSGWYVQERRDDERHVVAENPGSPLGRHDGDELYALALAEGLKASICLLSGAADPSLVPPDFYSRLGGDLQRNGTAIAADLAGEHLNALLEAKPAFIKVSDEELADDELADKNDEASIVKAAQLLRDRGAATVVVSRAEKPAIALMDDGAYQVRIPKLTVRDEHGAGDSMTAGVVAVLAQGGDLKDAIRTGAAAGTLNVTQHGLGAGRADAIAELVKLVELEPLESS
ncbi:1-phosphofructokinase family hexose kinase [Kribbella shirazensis]|uniref:1-phosphofructokinase n=1 Tax=Kribbella shirazensis TaxID=1105143 RepID=A0A7X5VER7_9ACTN|nr:PfkB family carbohydrate kinase [Kribbella shirazensis]NIK59890.1 1-phosphofructokinase [Kribbella shirazensis]